MSSDKEKISLKIQIGQNIKTIRVMKGFPLRYVAKQLGMSVSNLSNIENGATGIDMERIQRLAKIFELDHRLIIDFSTENYFSIQGGKATI